MGACNPLKGHHRQRSNLCERSYVCICKASNRCGKWSIYLFWGGTDSSVHDTNISETAVLPQLVQVILPSAQAEQIPCNTTSTHMHSSSKRCPNTHSLILPALLRSRHLCYPQITDWEAKGWNWRLEYSRRPKGTKGSIQLPQIPRYVVYVDTGMQGPQFWISSPQPQPCAQD